jgi:hypothetical protein
MFLCLGLLLFTTGCGLMQNTVKTYYNVTDSVFVATNYFIHPEFEDFKIRRVLIAPFSNETGFHNAQDTLEPIFISEWIKVNRFEVIPSTGDARKQLESFDIREKGTFYKMHLYDIAKRYNVDAVMFVALTSYSPYEPCRIGINAQLIHTYSGVVVWGLNEIYDGSQRNVENLATQYYYENVRFSHPLDDWEIMMISIRYFTQMVAFDVGGTFKDYYVPPRLDKTIVNAVNLEKKISAKPLFP